MERSLDIQLIVHGIELDEAYEGKLFTVKKREVISSGKPVPGCVHISYKVSRESDPSVCEQQYINREIPRAVDLFTQCLSLLLRRPSHLINYKAKLDGVVVEPTIQQYAPNLYNLVMIFHPDVLIPSGLSVCPPRDFWVLLENTISSYRQRADNVRRHLALALRWFKKGSDELNSPDRLVAFWISFNALYEDPEINKEQKRIEKYITSNVDSVIAQRYVVDNSPQLNELSGFPIELGVKNKTPVAKELACLLSVDQLDYTAVAGKSVFVIYGIRNNLFHGDYDPDSENHQKHMATAEGLLSFLVRELIVKEMTGKPLPVTIVSSEYFKL